jgi:hypothetical protein
MEDSCAGFGFGSDALWGIAQREKVLNLVQMFICPYANTLPIAVSSLFFLIVKPYFASQSNSLAFFFKEQIAKEIIYHVVFHTTSTCQVRLVRADIDAPAFRFAPHPLFDMLALSGSTISAFNSLGKHSIHFYYQCYHTLLLKLISIWGISDVLPAFPTVSQVHKELCETTFMLLHQQHDPGFPSFMIDVHKLCTIM